jgi:hypothetical protein
VKSPRACRFRHTQGAELASRKAGFEPLLDFPDLRRSYESSETVPFVSEPGDLLRCRFFLHGSRYACPAAIERTDRLQQGEKLYVTLELTNPVAGVAVQIQTTDYHVIGWAPRCLVNDLVQAMARAAGEYAAKVVRINPSPAPSSAEAVGMAIGDGKYPVTLMDAGDNIGGGSAGDSTFVLSQLLEQKAEGWAMTIADPAVETTIRAGVGGAFDLAVGGRTDDMHGRPVRIRGRVKSIHDEAGGVTSMNPARFQYKHARPNLFGMK